MQRVIGNLCEVKKEGSAPLLFVWELLLWFSSFAVRGADLTSFAITATNGSYYLIGLVAVTLAAYLTVKKVNIGLLILLLLVITRVAAHL